MIKALDRRGTSCVKWDLCENDDMIPLWVADMDFETAPAVRDAVIERAAHGIYGYTHVPDSYYEAVCSWFERRHAWKMTPEQIIYTIGVVPAISAIIDAMARPGDDVVTLNPMYNCFFSSIRNKGCRMSASELVYDRESGHFSIDFEDLERRLAEPKATVMLLCNPHNPTGRVWTREELTRIGDLCLKHGVFVISDEIHCEFEMPGHKYTPYASLGEEYAAACAVCTSPSKAFNIAGLQAANISVCNPEARRKIDRAINDAEICDLGVFGPIAVEAAYNKGEAWLDELNAYIAANYELLREFVDEKLPRLKVAQLEGTYLAWVDCSEVLGENDAEQNAIFSSTTKLCTRLKDYGVWVNPGDMYDCGASCFIRVNLACSRDTLAEALRRIALLLG